MNIAGSKHRPEIKTARLHLRPVRADDAERLVEYLGDYEVTKTLSRAPHPYPRVLASAWIARVHEAPAAVQANFIIDLGDGLSGGIVLRTLDETPDLGYWLARPHWGQGLMSEAVEAALQWLFDTSDHQTVASGCFEINPSSWRIQEKLGFEIVGHSRVHCLAQDRELPHIDTQLKQNQFRSRAP